MILFFVGIIEMTIAASWTRSVAKSSIALNGLITYANIFVWYYVIDQVVNHLHAWTAIIPYALGCALGSMLGSIGYRSLRLRTRRTIRALRRKMGLAPARTTRRTSPALIRAQAKA